VSCEAIPEEIGGTTPPSTHEPVLVSALKVQPPAPVPEPKAAEPPVPPVVIKSILVPVKSAPMAQEKGTIRTEKSPPQDSRPDPSALPPLSFRDRGHTISVMSPVKRPDLSLLRRNAAGGSTPRGSEPTVNSAGLKPRYLLEENVSSGK
jgi:hypothetical protein